MREVFRKYIGIPFIDGGRDIKGFDCYGLVKEFYSKQLGITLPEYYVSALETPQVVKEIKNAKSLWKQLKAPVFGCLVAIKLAINSAPDQVNHVGIYVENGFIHTLEKTGSVFSRLKDPFWSNRIEGFYQWRGING